MEGSQSVSTFLADAYALRDRVQQVVAALQAGEIAQAAALASLVSLSQAMEQLSSRHGFTQLARLHTLLAALYQEPPQELSEDAQSGKQQGLVRCVTHIDALVQQSLRRISRGEADKQLGSALFELEASSPWLARLHAMAKTDTVLAAKLRLEVFFDSFMSQQQDSLSIFLPEAHDLLQTMAEALPTIGAGDAEQGMRRFFRVLHTLKGSSYMLNLLPIGDVVHLLEDVLSLSREGDTPVADIVPTLRAGVATLQEMVRYLEDAEAGGQAQLRALLPQLRTVLAEKASSLVIIDNVARLTVPYHPEEGTVAYSAPESAEDETGLVGWPEPEVISSAVPIIPSSVGSLASELNIEATYDELQSQGSSLRVDKTAFDALLAASGQLVLAQQDYRQANAVMQALASQLETLHRYTKKLYQAQPSQALKALHQQLGRSRQQQHRAFAQRQQEYVVLQRLSQTLRQQISQSRMVPIAQLFSQLSRLVEQLANEHLVQHPEQRKQYRLEVSGGDVRIDSALLDALIAPLRHIITNALVHGIETLEVRAAGGKLPQGVIRLEAVQQDAHIRIDVSDDGQGMSRKAIRTVALERGIKTVQELSQMTDEDILTLVLLPGFSTASKVDKYAGRGVGLDVVNTLVRQLKGRLSIESQWGKGTRISLEIPASLNAHKVMKVQIGAGFYSLPAEQIGSLRRVPKALRKSKAVRESIVLEDNAITLYDARQLLGEAPSVPTPLLGAQDTLPVVMVAGEGSPMLLQVSQFARLESAILYPLPPLLRTYTHLLGISRLEDGQLLPILDAQALPSLQHLVPVKAPLHIDRHTKPAELSRARGHVLFAEDSGTVRQLVTQALRRRGFRVTAVADGQQALEVLLHKAIDVLVTDIEMPVMDGYELMEAISSEGLQRRSPSGKATALPIIVMSTRVLPEHRELAMSLGAMVYLTKPAKISQLVAKIDGLLGNKPSKDEAKTRQLRTDGLEPPHDSAG